jgi:hypothetical protein
VRLYGFTEILPGQVFTDVISDPGRKIIIDLIAREIIARNGAKIIGQMIFESGTSGYDNITDRPNLSDWADVIISDAAALDAALKNVIDNNLVNAINASSLGVREILATSLGYANYNDLAAKAQQGKTIVDGGLIRTSLIDAEAIVAKWVTAEVIASLNIVTSRLTVTNGAKIGGFNIVGSALSATSDLGAFILMWPGDNKTKLSLGRDATNFNALGYNSLMGEIVNRNVRPEYNSSTIALILSAMGELSGETYRNKNYALVANGGAYIGGSLCVFDEVEFNVDIDASMLLKCRKFIYSPTSTKNVYLPGRAAIEALFQSGLSRGGSSPGYMWSGKSVGYQSWIELDILVTRYATANVLVSSPVSGTDLVDNDGNVISSREMAKGDIITYCYYNNSWYMKVHN